MEAASFTAGAGEIGEIDEAADEELLAEGVGFALSSIGGGGVTVWGAAGGAGVGGIGAEAKGALSASVVAGGRWTAS